MSTQHTILVIEDQDLSRDMLVQRLQTRGFRTFEANNGRSGLDIVMAETVDLVLLDNAMPGLTGVDVLREIRQTWSHDSLPVIIVSAMVDSDDVVEALTAGANDYVVKPVNFKVLLARVATALRVKHNVSLLVEAERQRVLMESLAGTAARIAKPLGEMVDRLEALMENVPTDREATAAALHEVLELTEQTVDVIDQMRRVGSMRDVPYTARMDLLEDKATKARD